MKKLLLLVIMLLIVTGCSMVRKESIEEIVDNRLNSSLDIINENRQGYKYYLPKGLKITDKKDYNEIITSDKYTYYLYVDVLSYHKKIKEDYTKKSDVYYSSNINYNDLFGYIKIKTYGTNDYLIEIMFNYAKIEVIVDKKDINIAVSYIMDILSSIKYNDSIIDSTLGDDILQFNESEYNIFSTKEASNGSTYLEYEEEHDQYDGEIKDPDLIN